MGCIQLSVGITAAVLLTLLLVYLIKLRPEEKSADLLEFEELLAFMNPGNVEDIPPFEQGSLVDFNSIL